MRQVKTTPVRMVEENGSINFGTYSKPFRNANILDAPLYSFPVPNFWKKFRLKEWQHFGFITPTHYFGMVMFDAKFMGVSFLYVYDRISKNRFEHGRQGSGKSVRVARQLYDDTCRFDAKGYHLFVENKLEKGCHRILIDIDSSQDGPSVKGEIIIHEDLGAIEPLVQISPITRYRPFYTHKVAAPASGSVEIGSQKMVLERDTCVVLIDEQKTYYPYSSYWKWATAAGYGDNGKLLGFNLCQNIIAEDEDCNENCFWIDGKIFYLKAVRFEYNKIMEPWKIKTTDGKLNLSFTPLDERAQKINVAGIISSDFHQPFGLYNGSFKDDRGTIHSIKDFFGLAEYHATRY